MDNFKVIYKILKVLEKAMDYEDFDFSILSAEQLGITEERLCNLLIMMQEDGYIKGLKLYSFMSDDGKTAMRKPIKPVITIKGLEYLAENSFMKKAAEAAKGVVGIVK